MGGQQLARLSNVIAPALDECGPAMQQLSVEQRQFVVAMVEMGAPTPTDAARVAGYGGSTNVSSAAGRRLMSNPKVLAALREETEKFIGGCVLVAAKVLLNIALTTGHKDQKAAASELMTRGGMLIKTEHKVVVEDNRTPDDVIRKIIEIARTTGQDVKALIGYDPDLPVVEGEFTEVKAEVKAEVKPGEKGLEDIL